MPRILLVEDNELNRDMLSRRLRRKGFEVSLATDGLEGLTAAVDARPDLILMDLSLPGIDGWEVTRRLKADPATQSIPIIALTAHAMAGDRERAFEAGCDDYDMKPIDFTRLLAKINAILADQKFRISKPSSVDSGDGPGPTSPGQLRHDLVGPLVRIIGYCELLAEDDHALVRSPRSQALDAIRSLAHEIRRSIDGALLYPPCPDQPINLEALVASVLTPAHAMIRDIDTLRENCGEFADREAFFEDLDRIQKDAALLVSMVWKASSEEMKIAGQIQ